MGTGFHGGFGNSFGAKTLIEHNSKTLGEKYGLTNGYFGQKGKNVRIINCNNAIKTAQYFYETIGQGGTEFKLSNGKGSMTVLPDGTRIVCRIITKTPSSPAIEISISASPNIKNQKIHFIGKGE